MKTEKKGIKRYPQIFIKTHMKTLVLESLFSMKLHTIGLQLY